VLGSRLVVGLPDDFLARALVLRGEDGVRDGFARRLLEELGSEIGIEIEVRELPARELGLDLLRSGEIDALCPLSISQERVNQVEFTSPILVVHGGVFALRGQDLPSNEQELSEKRVAVARYGVGHEYCLEHNIPFQDLPTLKQAFESVLEGRADCVLTAQSAGRVDVQRYQLPGFVDVQLEEPRIAYAIALRPGNEYLAARMNVGLAALREKGVWDRLYQRWMEPFQPRPHPWPLWRLFLTLAAPLLLGAAGWLLVLRRSLARRTQALDESERRYRVVAESLPALVCSHFVDAEGKRERRFATSNLPQWIERFPSLGPDVDPSGFLAGVHPGDRAAATGAIEGAIREGRRYEVEFRLRQADGTHRWLHATALPLRRESGTLWQSLFLDVTPLREAQQVSHRLELQLAQAHELEGLGLLAGGVAHEFNNLLAAIEGHLELAGESQAGIDAHLQGARHSLRQAAELVRHLLTYAGEAHLVEETIDLSVLVRAQIERCEARWPHVRFERQLDPQGSRTRGDPALIRQVVSSLLTVAVESVPARRSGRIRVRSGARRLLPGGLGEALPELDRGDYVLLEIEELEFGLNAFDLRRAFGPFLAARSGERGPGLSIVQRIVQRHRGAIQVQSEPASGTSFRVFLPAAEEPALQEYELNPQGPGPRRVLVVDDDERVREVVCALLASRGWQVERAAGGEQALQALQHGEPDVVLLDLVLPGTDGQEVLQRLRRERSRLPIVLMTGYSSVEPTAHTQGFLQKPFTGQELVAALERALASKEVEPPAPAEPLSGSRA